MLKALRFLIGLVLTALLLEAAQWGVQDCPAGRYTFDNCRWLWLRERFGLPASKLGRAVTMELMGLALLAGLYLAFRCISPPFRARGVSRRGRGMSEPVDLRKI